MPSLQWIGKDKVINHHLAVPFRVLEHQYGFDNGLEKTNACNSGNKIIHGDNLEALKSLLPEYEGRVDCIYIDPPYNTGNENWVYNDNLNDPKIKKWLGQVVGKEAEDFTRHDKWLCMMYPRLALLHKLLANDGVIFISIDDNELTYLRMIMNEIFGSENFRNHIIIKRGTKSVQAQFENIDKLGIACEYIVCYTKNATVRLPQFYFDLEERKQGSWNNHWRGTNRPTMRYPLMGITPATGQWRWSEQRSLEAIENYKRCLQDLQVQNSDPAPETIDNWYKENASDKNEEIDLLRLSKSNKPEHYIAATDKKFGNNLWTDLVVNGTSEFNKYSEAIFENPKNPKIIERILNWTGTKECIVLDSFGGSGTTAHAVLNLNRQDGGNRKFILVEMEDYASTITAGRVKRVIGSNKNFEGNSFDYFELGPSLFNDDNEINVFVGVDKLRQYIYYSETRSFLTVPQQPDNAYFLNKHETTAYYFYYEPGNSTALDYEFLSTIKTYAALYIIYADKCLLSQKFMTDNHIIFKKIPRDITKF